jgi:hypothetical protein
MVPKIYNTTFLCDNYLFVVFIAQIAMEIFFVTIAIFLQTQKATNGSSFEFFLKKSNFAKKLECIAGIASKKLKVIF